MISGCALPVLAQHVEKVFLISRQRFVDFHTELAGNLLRAGIVTMDDGIDTRKLEVIEGVGEGGAGRFGGVTFAPAAAAEDPSSFDSRNAIRVAQTGAADDFAGGFFLHRPDAEAAQ